MMIQWQWQQMEKKKDATKWKMMKTETWHCWVTTGRKERSQHSYLEKPWHICWWRTWNWGWGCCRPHHGTQPTPPRSVVLDSPRCSGKSSGMESELRRCRSDKAGWRTACRCTLCPWSSLWSCDLEGICADKIENCKAETWHLGICQIKRTLNSTEPWSLSW